MIKAYLLVFSLFVAQVSFANIRCQGVFQSSSGKAQGLIDRIGNYNPELATSIAASVSQKSALTDIYLALKEEGWRLNPQGLIPWKDRPELSSTTVEALSRLVENRFDPAKVTRDADYYQFYSNAVQGLAILAARHVEASIVDRYRSSNNPVNQWLARMVSEAFFPGLGERELSPERARELLHSVQNEIRWPLMVSLAERFTGSNEQLRGWLSQQPEASQLEPFEISLLLRGSVDHKGKDPYCCRSTPGCVFCPNNRGFLKFD